MGKDKKGKPFFRGAATGRKKASYLNRGEGGRPIRNESIRHLAAKKIKKQMKKENFPNLGSKKVLGEWGTH